MVIDKAKDTKYVCVSHKLVEDLVMFRLGDTKPLFCPTFDGRDTGGFFCQQATLQHRNEDKGLVTFFCWFFCLVLENRRKSWRLRKLAMLFHRLARQGQTIIWAPLVLVGMKDVLLSKVERVWSRQRTGMVPKAEKSNHGGPRNVEMWKRTVRL